jgi:hypothetical protein
VSACLQRAIDQWIVPIEQLHAAETGAQSQRTCDLAKTAE